RVGRRSRPSADELQPTRDAEDRRVENGAQPVSGLDDGVRFGSKHDQISTRDGEIVSITATTDLSCLLLCPRGVAGAEHDLVACLDEPPRECEAEVASATDDRDFHAGTAPSA